VSSVNVIIRLKWSLLIRPKVITLSGFYCINKRMSFRIGFSKENVKIQSLNFVCRYFLNSNCQDVGYICLWQKIKCLQPKFWHLGSISPTYLGKVFMCKDPKSIKIQSSHQYLAALWGSLRLKIACKMLMKLIQCFIPKSWKSLQRP